MGTSDRSNTDANDYDKLKEFRMGDGRYAYFRYFLPTTDAYFRYSLPTDVNGFSYRKILTLKHIAE